MKSQRLPYTFGAIVSLLTLASSSIFAQATISDGDITVAVNQLGLLIDVPSEGIQTYDGKTALLQAGTPEWFGVCYDDASGHHEFVGSGLQPDWATGRASVVPVSFQASDREVFAVTRAGDLEITTWIHFDPDGPYLLASAELRNVGSRTLTNIYYTREWGNMNRSWSYPADSGVSLPLGAQIQRSVWMFGDMTPDMSTGAGFSYIKPSTGALPSPDGGVDVPLSEWMGGSWPAGLVVGETNGISWGDHNADGFPDIVALEGGNVIENLNGQDWAVVANLKTLLPASSNRYGTSFGDYNEDGLPDIATEPRRFSGDTCAHLFRNDGAATFVDVSGDPAIVDLQACDSDAESICWGDVDGDSRLDWFLPVYPSWHGGGPGNFFYYNLGPVGPGGAYAFQEQSFASGLDNPCCTTARPEGAQFVDTDFDGDFDLYSNGTLYRNISTPGTALFDNPTANAGIQFSDELEEGIVFFDKEMDGDFDFFSVYTNGTIGVRVFEARGDGSYKLLSGPAVESHLTGLNLGISAADWDNDGDIDFTTRQVFRKNQFMETGTASFTVATTGIPATHLTSATPAWADWDLDGDLDCALGNWQSTGHFYENTLYGAGTSDNERRNVRVRVMRDSATVPAGLETEYGAIVEIHVAGEENGPRRKRFVSSSGGYLNQDEYPVHFALPADPAPGDAAVDLTFDVTVDLSGPPGDGFLRIDKHVNPVLGGVQFAELVDREITVFRSGKVILDGCTFDPGPAQSIVHNTTTGGLDVPTPTTALAALTAVPADTLVGLEFDTLAASGPVRLVEVILDGQLDLSTDCSGELANITVWEIAPFGPFFLASVVDNGRLDGVTVTTNDRTYLRTNVLLEPGKVYRVFAAVTESRLTAIAGPVTTGGVTVLGGFSYTDLNACDIDPVVTADPSFVPMALRFSEDPGAPFVNLGFGQAGASGVPSLTGTGTLKPGSPYSLDLTSAAPNAAVGLAVGFSANCFNAFGTTIVPALDSLVGGLMTDGTGALSVSDTWPVTFPAGTSFYYQMAVIDPTAPFGIAFSNAMAGSTQP